MEGFRKLNNEEIQALHADLAAFIERNWVSNENPDIRIPPFVECDVGIQALTCEILEASTLRLGRAKASLQERFPGADVYVEKTPTNGAYLKLEVPIWVEDDYQYHGGHSGQSKDDGGSPSSVYGMFLFMSDILLYTILYFRLAGGGVSATI